MKKEELMIDDLVYIYHPSQEKTAKQIDADTLVLMGKIELGFIKHNSPIFRIIEPIPLVPETLIASDFIEHDLYPEYKSYIYATDKQYCHIRLYPDGEIRVIAKDESIPTKEIQKNITAVHELQHALKEVGIKKKIKL